MSPMDRRKFITLTAITGTTAVLAQCGSPENQIIRFIPDDDITPGVAVWKPSICPLCRAGCGVIARLMEGEAEVFRGTQPGVVRMVLAKKLEGNPADPISQGKLCPRGQAAIQVTYHPDRLDQPMKRRGERGSGRFEPITWDAAIAELVSTLDALAASKETASLAFLGRPRGPRRQQIVAQFLARFGAKPAVTFEPFSDDVLRRANALSFGAHQLPTIDLAHTKYLLAFGADFLGTWNSPVSQSAGYGRLRSGQGGRGKVVQVEARMSTTGASADEWVAIRPGTDGVLALGLAHVLIGSGVRPAAAAGNAGSLIEGWASGLAEFTPARVEEVTGVLAARVERLAREMASNAPAGVLVGGAALAHTNGLFTALAVNALNALLGSVGQPGGIVFTPGAAPAPAGEPVTTLLKSLPKVLLLDEANPVFGLPAALKVADALRQVPFIASFGSFIDDTSAMADLILPDHSFLESWVDRAPESGANAAAATVTGPVMRPLYQTRAMPDVLLDVSRRLAAPIAPPLPKSFEEFVQAPMAAAAGTRVSAYGKFAGRSAGTEVPASAARFVAPQFDGDARQYPLHFLPYVSQALLDGSLAHLPWLQEMPDPLTSAMWSTWIEINPATAASLGIAQADVVEVASAHGVLHAPAVLSPGIAPDVIAMPVGQGHQNFTRYASGRGANPIRVLAPLVEPETGALAWAATRVRLTRVSSADGSLILFAGSTRERPDEHSGR